MKQQEIKENLPPLPYFASSVLNGEIVSVRDNRGNSICEIESHTDNDTDEAICRGIVHAINNTYGKGINPESVEDMFNVLQNVVGLLGNMQEYKMAKLVQDVLNKAAL